MYDVAPLNGKYSFAHNQVPDNLVPLFPGNIGISYQWEKTTSPISNPAAIPLGTNPTSQSAIYVFNPTEFLTAPATYFRRKTTLAGGTVKYSGIIKLEMVSAGWENLNYIREHDITVASQTNWKVVDLLPIGSRFVTTTYLDGLGRPVQKVSRETATPETGSSTWGDIVQFSRYDALGRQPLKDQPYTTTTEPGKYKTAALTEQPQYHTARYNETTPYNTITYESSPLGRVTGARSPGTSSLPASIEYELNDAADDVKIFSIGYSPGDVPTLTGVYGPNTLYKTVNTDGDGKRVVEYTDAKGQIILSKVQLDENPSASYSGWICTYSVYDDFGLLRYRFQPEAIKWLAEHNWSFTGTDGQKVLSDQCFRYEYDIKGRVILKKAPGVDPLYFIYDQRDRLVFMQDGNQRAKSPGEWTFNLYDELDRPIVTALYQTTKTTTALQADINNAPVSNMITIAEQNVTIVAYRSPVTSTDLNNPAVTTVLKYNFYDDYSYAGAKTFVTAVDNTQAYPTNATNGDPLVSTKRTTSMPTGNKVRVLGTATFLSTTVYYDDKARLLQVQEDNIKTGVDVTTYQYKFDGRLLSINTKHSATGTGYTNYSIVTKNIFDNIARIIGIEKKFGANAFKAIASYAYDDMGRLKTKRLAPGYTATGKNELESLDYSYNIHNEITGINKDYALKTPGKYNKWGNFFGLYLGYDNQDGVFVNAQLDGHVTGLLWTTQGDDVQRKFDFTYDNAGRLITALFNEKQSPGDAWSNTKMDFSVTGSSGKITYDLNGNLLSMLQKGVIPGNTSPIVVDDLTYQYADFSNKLVKVTDNGTLGTANGKLGDFADGSNGAADDYVYDNNGNLVIDLNKNAKELEGVAGANGIRYNFLDKPEEIRIAGKGVIKIIYDANGTKLQRTYTPESGATATTSYINSFVYRENALEYINFEEGRVRVMTAVNQSNPYDYLTLDGNMNLMGGKRGTYDFFIRDYQANVRMIVTEQIHVGSNTATMETNRAQNEEPLFGKVDENGDPTVDNEIKLRFPVANIPGQGPGTGWTSGSIGDYVARVGNLAGRKTGPNALLRVMAGDEVSATTIYYYQQPVVNTAGTSIVTDILGSLVQVISGSGSTTGILHGQTIAGSIVNQLDASVPFASATSPHAGSTAGNNPKAYLTILFFDERFNFVGSDYDRVSQAGNGAPPLTLAQIKAPKNGYAYVYVSNESDEMVYFDNLQITHNRGRIIEENHYYAYGLRISGISSRKLPDASDGSIKNNYLYNDKELFEEADLNWYDYGFRNYDPQIGRFTQLDPLTDEFPYLTPYQYASCEPIANIDLDGLEAMGATNAATDAALNAAGISTGWMAASKTLSGVVVKSVPKAAAKRGFWGNVGRFFGGVKDGFVESVTFAVNVFNPDLEKNSLVQTGKFVVNTIKDPVGTVKGIIQTIEETDWSDPATYGKIVSSVASPGGALKVVKYASKGSKGAKVAKLNSRTKKAIPDCGCFVAGTLVLTDSGYKRIEEIRKGDIVWAYNDTTQEYARKRVVEIFEYVRDTIYTIQIGDERINATSDHPFFIGGRWLKVAELQAGDSVITYDGKKLVITAIEKKAGQTKVYNFAVEDYHTYYVTGLNILVHNSTGPCFVKDYATKNTKNYSAFYKTEREARNLARQKLGKNPIQVEPNKWRSVDGKWQYRAKPGDLKENHIHLEELNPKTGEVLQNLHLRWK